MTLKLECVICFPKLQDWLYKKNSGWWDMNSSQQEIDDQYLIRMTRCLFWAIWPLQSMHRPLDDNINVKTWLISNHRFKDTWSTLRLFEFGVVNMRFYLIFHYRVNTAGIVNHCMLAILRKTRNVCHVMNTVTTIRGCACLFRCTTTSQITSSCGRGKWLPRIL